MGLFPTCVAERRSKPLPRPRSRPLRSLAYLSFTVPVLGDRVKPRAITVFTRQLETLADAGPPLLRGLRILEQQETHGTLKRIIGLISEAIEGGSALSEALAAHPRVFSQLYVNMVKAGELSGALELTLRRLAELQEKAQKIKGKIKSGMYYPIAVMSLALGILILIMLFTVPRFQQVFEGLLNGVALLTFTSFILRISKVVRDNVLWAAITVCALGLRVGAGLRTNWGRWVFDQFKLSVPILGGVFRKAAISRFARTLGTLLGSGVPACKP